MWVFGACIWRILIHFYLYLPLPSPFLSLHLLVFVIHFLFFLYLPFILLCICPFNFFSYEKTIGQFRILYPMKISFKNGIESKQSLRQNLKQLIISRTALQEMIKSSDRRKVIAGNLHLCKRLKTEMVSTWENKVVFNYYISLDEIWLFK